MSYMVYSSAGYNSRGQIMDFFEPCKDYKALKDFLIFHYMSYMVYSSAGYNSRGQIMDFFEPYKDYKDIEGCAYIFLYVLYGLFFSWI